MLLDAGGRFIPVETTGHADVIANGLRQPLAIFALLRRITALRELRVLAAELWRPGQDSNLRPAA